MASRRSRLKAVTNLPIRRKPVSLQEESEISKAGDYKTADPVSEEKEPDVKGCDDSDRSEKPQCSEIGKISSSEHVEIEPEKHNKTEVPPVDVPTQKPSNDIKSLPNPASRFGRRIKPSVSSVVLKDKTPREVHVEGHAQSNEKPTAEESQLMLNESDVSTTNENELNKNFTEFETISKDITLPIVSETVETKTFEPVYVPTENVMEVVEVQEGLNNNENQQLLNSSNEVNLRTFKEVMQSSMKSPVNKVQQNTSVHTIDHVDKVASDGNTKQGNEMSPNHSNILEYFPNQLTPPSNSNLQNSSPGVKRTLSTFKQKKPKFNDFARKVADARREFQRKYEKIPPDRSSLRMIDLIFYNPSTNPMESKSKCERRDSHSIDEELLDEKVDDPEPLDKSSEINDDDDDVRNEDFGKMPVPQVKIGLNGEIILDEKSLVIETTEAKKGREDLQNSALIFEDRGSKTCYYKRKTHKSRDWSDLETKRFYKALNTIGTDFSLMQKYFPVRTRLELKNKFKREEKLNRNLIDKALNNPSEFDITQFEKYLAMEKQIEEEETERRLQRKIKLKKNENRVRTKSSLMAREITEPDENVAEFQSSSNPDNTKIMLNDKSKPSNEISLLGEKYTLQTSEEIIGGNVQESSLGIIFDGNNQGNGFSSSSRVFTSLNELNNANKIRDAFDEIQNIGHSESNPLRTEIPENVGECGEMRNNTTGNVDVVDEFYQAVVSLSASLKSDECKNRLGKRVRSKNEKKKIVPYQKKSRKSPKDYPFMSTLDIETYELDCDNYSSSNESNDNSIMSTKTISDQDFIKLLAANAKNMKESKIQFQITEGCSFEKNVEIILDNVPSIALSEI